MHYSNLTFFLQESCPQISLKQSKVRFGQQGVWRRKKSLFDSLVPLSLSGQLPSLIGSVHRTRHTPIPSIVLLSIISCLVLLPEATNFRSLLNFVVFFHWLQKSLSVAALVRLRRSRPDLQRPLRVFILAPVIFFVVTLFLVAAPFVKYPIQQLYGICIILPVIPLYLVFIKYKLLPERFYERMDDFTTRVQKIGNLATIGKLDSAASMAGDKLGD